MRLLRGAGRERIMVVRVPTQDQGKNMKTTKSRAGHHSDIVAWKASAGPSLEGTRTADDLPGDSFSRPQTGQSLTPYFFERKRGDIPRDLFPKGRIKFSLGMPRTAANKADAQTARSYLDCLLEWEAWDILRAISSRLLDPIAVCHTIIQYDKDCLPLLRRGLENSSPPRRPNCIDQVDPERRFWDKVQRGDGCWTWTAARDADGYGVFWHEGKTVKAHRHSYQITHGAIPDGQLVCHTCDNPTCVNPAHMFLGTDQDNSDDKVRKNRQWRPSGDSFFGPHMHNTMHTAVHNESRPASCQTAYRVVSRGFMPGAGLEPACLAAEDFKSPPANID